MRVANVDGRATLVVDARAVDVSLERLLAEADVVSVHAPLTSEAHGLIGAEELGRMMERAKSCAR